MSSPGRIILGIETSCDETAASVVRRGEDGSATILSNVIFSQFREHAEFGGVVPEIAARAHVERLDGIVVRALEEAGMELDEVHGIAVTAGPGLAGGLIVGLMTAKALAAATGKPLYCINHLEGHALTARMTHGLSFPYLLLLVSGGHTQILAVNDVGDYQRYASTIDDALGEAFDKTAKLLGLSHPGGPAVEKMAMEGEKDAIPLPRPLKGEARPDFSFSGLKTAVRQAAMERAPLDRRTVADLCASFQAAVTDTVTDRVARSLLRFRQEHEELRGPMLVAAGGVAANAELRSNLARLCEDHGFKFVAPPLALCSDNAAMIAWAALERIGAAIGDECAMDATPRARWPLDEGAVPILGSGRKGAKA